MEKVLLVGRISNSLQIIHDQLNELYQVQLCTPVFKNLEGMIKIVKPNIIVLFQSIPGEIDSNIMMVLKNDWESIPVIIICEEKEKHEFVSYISEQQTVFMFRPVKHEKLIQRIENILNNVSDEAEVVAVKSEKTSTLKPRVMVVDDNPIVLRNVKQILGDAYECYLAPSGEKAISMLSKVEVDIILLDYEMPGLSGVDTFKLIKDNEALTHVPVIFLTAVADKHRILEVLTYHPAGYMLKPIEADKLRETVSEILEIQIT